MTSSLSGRGRRPTSARTPPRGGSKLLAHRRGLTGGGSAIAAHPHLVRAPWVDAARRRLLPIAPPALRASTNNSFLYLFSCGGVVMRAATHRTACPPRIDQQFVPVPL